MNNLTSPSPRCPFNTIFQTFHFHHSNDMFMSEYDYFIIKSANGGFLAHRPSATDEILLAQTIVPSLVRGIDILLFISHFSIGLMILRTGL